MYMQCGNMKFIQQTQGTQAEDNLSNDPSARGKRIMFPTSEHVNKKLPTSLVCNKNSWKLYAFLACARRYFCLPCSQIVKLFQAKNVGHTVS